MKYRTSSTQLATFAACPRKWKHVYVDGRPDPVGKAAHVGTVFHALVEFYMTRGYFPSFEATRRLPGNYSPTSDALTTDGAEVYKTALAMAKHVEAEGVIADTLAIPGTMYIERALDDMKVRLGDDTLAGGFFDVLHVGFGAKRAVITDWKTRGKTSWTRRPRSAEDFEANIQLTYYAAMLALADLSLEVIEVRHVNVLRADQGGPAVMIDSHVFDSSWLRAEVVWRLNETVLAMEAVREGAEAEQNRGACHMYGPCPFLGACATTEMIVPEGLDFFAAVAAAKIIEEEKP